jgi:hypothetical protein
VLITRYDDATHMQKKFRLDANKDDARDRWFTWNLLAKICTKGI